MKSIPLVCVCTLSVLLAAGCSDDNPVAPPGKNAEAVVAGPVSREAVVVAGSNDPFRTIRDAEGGVPGHRDDLLYRRVAHLVPIRAPDGHHVSLGEWTRARGTATVDCSSLGLTRYTLTFRGLLPFGGYSVWNILYDRPLTPEQPFGLRVAGGALGPGNGVKNFFTASRSGEGQLAVSVPPGPMGFGGTMPGCALTDAGGFALIVVYHIDGKRPGSWPGPAHTQVDQLIFYY